MTRKQLSILFIITAVAAALTAACSTTRRIPDDEILYTGTRSVRYLNADSSTHGVFVSPLLKTAITTAVDVPPNNYWSLVGWRYPFPLGLWVYNNWDNPPHGFKHWIYEKLVEQPVLVSDVRPEIRTRMIDQLLSNQGYFGVTSSYDLVQGRNRKKASIQYNVFPGKPYNIASMELLPDTTALNRMIDSLARRDSYLTAGQQFSTDSLSAARTRITNRLRNRGYYFFQPEFIEFLADTVAQQGSVAMRMMLATGVPQFCLVPYLTGDVRINVFRRQGGGRPDTVSYGDMTMIQLMPSNLRRSVMPECVTFRPGKLFSVRDMNRTQTNLSRLGIFSGINIDVMPDTSVRGQHKLDAVINCTMDKPLEVSFEANATSKSNSYIGPGVIIGLTNRNIFGGGEQLSVRANGSYEWQTGSGNRNGIFNSYEAGLTGALAIPRLVAPAWVPRSKYQLSWTRFSLNADLLNRPHYFKMAQFNAAMTYDWRVSRHVQAAFTPVKLTYTKLMHTTAAFDSIMDANPAVALSFKSQYIPQMQYQYTYDRTLDADNTINYQLTLQEAGNLFWCIYEACGRRGEKTLFNTPFSQFVKATTQLVYGRRVGQGDNWLVSRLGVGAAHAYGNSSQVPYAEQFYIGGANSIRAFTVRSIGPGSYHAPKGSPEDNFDQTGTFKLEANVEYRFPIYGMFHGAAFLDAGNIWLLKADPLRPGGELKASTFLRDIALGTGVGLRVDISMLVVRADLGIGIHAPYDTGRRGYYNMPSFDRSLALHLAIGYPF